ncbi:hypothetical protein P4O66_018522 [Electrophorus voltai]|uniref:Uncharacterized protein n=1 Tax=Electrophorus voltai TaxID=2609070 RepID=A0AAD8YQS4_9TELE|nr:hypothetical protein P4O66_018522 [Electrophorus voltai]
MSHYLPPYTKLVLLSVWAEIRLWVVKTGSKSVQSTSWGYKPQCLSEHESVPQQLAAQHYPSPSNQSDLPSSCQGEVDTMSNGGQQTGSSCTESIHRGAPSSSHRRMNIGTNDHRMHLLLLQIKSFNSP